MYIYQVRIPLMQRNTRPVTCLLDPVTRAKQDMGGATCS